MAEPVNTTIEDQVEKALAELKVAISDIKGELAYLREMVEDARYKIQALTNEDHPWPKT